MADSLNNEADPVRRTAELCLRRCEGSLTAEQSDELSELLGASDAARDEYWRLVAVHSELQWELGGKRGPEPGSETPMVAAAEAVAAIERAEASASRRAGVRGLGWFALAACLMLSGALGLWSAGPREGAEATVASRPIGQIVPLVASSSWSCGRPGADNTTLVAGDTLCLDEGAVDLRLDTDTVAMLEAPAIVQAISADRFRLIRGGLKVEVADGAEGFTVETESAEVIDLGTVFSVSVASGATDLVVFDGEVDLMVANSPDRTGEGPKRFTAGEAVQVSKNGTLSRIVQVRQSRGDDPVITSVRDDSVREDFWRFYEIVPGGMQEDAAAFVDRPHQWNGPRGRRLPEYLLDGDYVKTFNDDKVARDLEIELALSQPAVLYVLLDTRVSPPGWLLADFEETGDRVGVDEAHVPHASASSKTRDLASGPGASIDRLHSVWKREFPQGGVVTLGPNGDLTDDSLSGVEALANMYGIVAVPLISN